MKAKLVALAALATLSSGVVFAGSGYGSHDKPDDADIYNYTHLSNDIHVAGYGLALGLIKFGAESAATVNSDQISMFGTTMNFGGENKARLGGNALRGAEGNIGVNVSAGAGNAQANDAALTAVDGGGSSHSNGYRKDHKDNDAAAVFAAAQVFSSQTGKSNLAMVSNAENVASLNGNALRNAAGNIGVNIASGAGNLQNNGMAGSTNSSGTLAKATSSNAQASFGNVLFELGCDPVNSAVVSGNALRGATGNIGLNLTAGAGNLQHNGLAIATATAPRN
ncbi:cell surface protein [Imbroritus primus]|uniref:Cell surface protein n=1 Tax=Imbroritus primus TaxID=3058603 RepID=A0ACD3STX5_9BURK|nr:cell surface protein [Burkholderiaceae bacterium PBA]